MPVMFNNNLDKFLSPAILIGLLFPIIVVFAQNGSIEPPVETSSTTTPVPEATGTSAATSTSRGEEAQVSTPATSTPRVTPPSINGTPTVTTTTQAQDIPATEDAPTGSSANLILWVALAMLAVLPFGYLAVASLKGKKTKEDKKDDSKCFNIKKLLDEKLKELTDLKGRIESEAKNKAKEAMRGAVQGTSAGETLAMVEKAEKEYERLKKLYEECIVEFGANKKRVIIVHGWEGDPNKNWIPWLKLELEKAGYEVIAPAMPNTDAPEIGAWVEHLSKTVGAPDKNTYFVGHSVGCQTILRYLETVEQPVGGAVFVAGWFNLENLEDEESEKIIEPWIKTPIRISKVIKALPKSALLISDNDPFGAFEENTRKFKEIESRIVVLPRAGHIHKLEESAILSEFLSLFGDGR